MRARVSRPHLKNANDTKAVKLDLDRKPVAARVSMGAVAHRTSPPRRPSQARASAPSRCTLSEACAPAVA